MTTKWDLTRLRRVGAEFGGHMAASHSDVLGTEEPLELRILRNGVSEAETLAIAMRTPGHDEDLLTGLLIAEGIVWRRNQIEGMLKGAGVLTARIVDAGPLSSADGGKASSRRLMTSSACGTCSKTDWTQVLPRRRGDVLVGEKVSLAVTDIMPLLLRLTEMQPCFGATGAVHGTALFNADLELLTVAEDVGRHNAFDKAVGRLFLQSHEVKGDPLCLRKLAVVSGRIGFELVQKAIMAGIEVIIAYGAPTSAAAELAQQHDITLVGMAREDRCNIYTHDYRIRGIMVNP